MEIFYTFQSQVDITTVFVSNVRWEDIRPSLGASPDPYFIDVSTPDKEGELSNPLALLLVLTHHEQLLSPD